MQWLICAETKACIFVKLLHFHVYSTALVSREKKKKKKKKTLNLVALWKFSDLSTSQCVFHGLNEIKIGLGIRFDF